MTRRFPRSLPEFQKLFPDESACIAYLIETRWPEGFQCPRLKDAMQAWLTVEAQDPRYSALYHVYCDTKAA